MYRQLLFITLSLHATSGAPQDERKSEITHFEIQPVIKSSSDVKADNTGEIYTESPTIISIVANIKNNNTSNPLDISETEALVTTVTEINGTKTDKLQAYVDSSASVNKKNKNQSILDGDVEPIDKKEEIQFHEDTIPAETIAEREARDFEDQTTSSYETDDLNATERPEVIIEDTKTSPKFVPKASYFKKFGGSSSYNKNYIQNPNKKRFRSRCRCEKIWNCPKLQITVPRCPEEQFMCCF